MYLSWWDISSKEIPQALCMQVSMALSRGYVTIKTLYAENVLTGSKKQVLFLICAMCVVTEQRLEDIQVKKEMSPKKITLDRKECGILKSSVLSELKALSFQFYKMPVTWMLMHADTVGHINFCHWMLQPVHDRIAYPMLLST
jgi:hypothetical protein